jgi:hypothetical protein
LKDDIAKAENELRMLEEELKETDRDESENPAMY